MKTSEKCHITEKLSYFKLVTPNTEFMTQSITAENNFDSLCKTQPLIIKM